MKRITIITNAPSPELSSKLDELLTDLGWEFGSCDKMPNRFELTYHILEEEK